MSKSREHWLTAMVLLLLAGTSPATESTWITWILMIGGGVELLRSAWHWTHWPWNKE